MRDVLIATTILAAGVYAAWSYEPAPAEISLASVVADDVVPVEVTTEQDGLQVAASPTPTTGVTTPLPNPWRHIPMPMAKPAQSVSVALAERAPAPSQDIAVLHAGLIEIDGERHALFGVDAPSVNQTCRNASSGLWACGTDARKAVATFLQDRDVVCTPVTRQVADAPAMSRCLVDGVDLNAWVVSSGWAVADTTVDDRLVAAQGNARSSKSGLWTGWFEAPAEWRARNDDDDGVRVASRDENRA